MGASRKVRDLITRASRLATITGAGETMDPDDAADALLSCNLMLDAWQADNLFAFTVADRSAALTAGVGSYTVGVGGAINVARPSRIEWAFTRDSQGFDRKINIVPREVYEDILLKTQGSTYPSALYYETSYPLGVITLWRVPPAGLTLHFGAWEQLSEFASLDDSVSLPPGYEQAIVCSLSEVICPEYGKQIPAGVREEAARARARIRSNNLPDMRMVCEFTGISGRTLVAADYAAGNY